MSDSTRDRLIRSAMKLFWEKGYGTTSVSDIVRDAGAHSGSLYHFFPTKQDLLVAVLEQYHDGIRPMLLDPAWRDVEDPIERVFALLAAYRARLVDTDCFYGCPIGSLALELHEADPIVRRRMAENFSNWVAAIRGCLEQAPGRLPPDTDLQALAEFVLTAMEGGVMQARHYRDVGYFDRTVAQLRSHFDALAARARVPLEQGEVT